MSHTDKDRPYWVRLNQDAKYTDHDHRHLGKIYLRSKPVKDEHGKKVYEEVPEYRTADQIAYLSQTRPADMKRVRQAKELIGAGRGDELIQIGTRTRLITETVEMQVPDHCTEGEPVTNNRWDPALPCSPEMPSGEPWWHYGESSTRQSYLRYWHGSDRSRVRNTLRNMEKAANSGMDGWEDDFEHVEKLTNQYRHGMTWVIF